MKIKKQKNKEQKKDYSAKKIKKQKESKLNSMYCHK